MTKTKKVLRKFAVKINTDLKQPIYKHNERYQ